MAAICDHPTTRGSSGMIQFCGRTDVGRRRHRNEDSILVGDGILVVCDGMGGHQAGDVASRIGVDTIGTFISRSGADPDLTWPYGFDPSLSFDANRVRTAIKLANRAIFTRAAAEDEYAGMGTTVVATIVAADDLIAGDTVLLCSDGLTNMLEDDAILEIVGRYDGHLAKTCDQLVDSANARGGRDNISAILLRYE